MKQKRYVIKVGSSLLTDEKGKCNTEYIEMLVKHCAAAPTHNAEVILVSSGAVAAGVGMLHETFASKTLMDKQILSAVGQVELMNIYRRCFAQYNRIVAQLLLTRSDVQKRDRYMSIRNAMMGMLAHNIVPIINENDTVSTEEIRFGDNDTLSALVASKVDADYLIILTDVDGLYTTNPRDNANASLIKTVHNFDELASVSVGKHGTARGTGGMITKISAAKIAHSSGVTAIIANGTDPNVLKHLFDRDDIGTRFIPEESCLSQRKRWLAFSAKIAGTVIIDDGAKAALCTKGKSLLPAGVIDAQDRFQAGDVVEITDTNGDVIAHGVVSYSSSEIKKILRCKSSEIQTRLGYKYTDEIIHRDHVVILHK